MTAAAAHHPPPAYRVMRRLSQLAPHVVLLAYLLLALFPVFLMIINFKYTPLTNVSRDWSIKTLGQQLLTRYFLVFELISLLLAVAIIGAIMIAGIGQKRD